MQWSLLLYNFQWQSKLSVHAHLDGYVKALFSMCPDTPPSLSGLEHVCICIPFPDWWWVQALFCTGQDQEGEMEHKKGSKERSLPLLQGRLTPLCQECTIPCLLNKRSVCLSCNWAVTSFESLLQQDRSWEILPAWVVIRSSFQIFVMMRQEPRGKNKPAQH